MHTSLRPLAWSQRPQERDYRQPLASPRAPWTGARELSWQTHAQLNAGFFLRSIWPLWDDCVHLSCPKTHSSFSALPRKNTNTKCPSIKDVASLRHRTFSSSRHANERDPRLTILSQRQHGVLPTSTAIRTRKKRRLLPKQEDFSKCTLRVLKMYP